MKQKDTFKNVPAPYREIIEKMFDLAIERFLKNIYKKVTEKERKEIEKALVSKNKKVKERIVAKYFPNLEEMLKVEAQKITEEVENKIRNQI